MDNIVITITKEEFIAWYNNQEQKCYYCDRTLGEIKRDITEQKTHKNRLTIDRKDNNGGYSINNIALACRRCNEIKGNYFTENKMLEIGKILYGGKIK
jgi:5-methylcytosine-specific restriction endonuclease McrA